SAFDPTSSSKAPKSRPLLPRSFGQREGRFHQDSRRSIRDGFLQELWEETIRGHTTHPETPANHRWFRQRVVRKESAVGNGSQFPLLSTAWCFHSYSALNTAICVGGPNSGCSTPTGRNRTL